MKIIQSKTKNLFSYNSVECLKVNEYKYKQSSGKLLNIKANSL